MSYWIRDYKCGCVPAEEYFCKEADKHVWIERDAVAEWALDGDGKDDSMLVEADLARRWLAGHYKEQYEAGNYKDVNIDSLAPDNEGSRVAGYPS